MHIFVWGPAFRGSTLEVKFQLSAPPCRPACVTLGGARVVSLRTVAVALGDRGAPRHTSALARCKVKLPLFLDSKIFVSRILALPSPKALCSVLRVTLRLQLLRPACALGHADVELPVFASWAAFPSSELRGNREAAPPLTPRAAGLRSRCRAAERSRAGSFCDAQGRHRPLPSAWLWVARRHHPQFSTMSPRQGSRPGAGGQVGGGS